MYVSKRTRWLCEFFWNKVILKSKIRKKVSVIVYDIGKDEKAEVALDTLKMTINEMCTRAESQKPHFFISLYGANYDDLGILIW